MKNWTRSGWSFIGLVGLRDPPKPGVREAIKEMNVAGVQVGAERDVCPSLLYKYFYFLFE